MMIFLYMYAMLYLHGRVVFLINRILWFSQLLEALLIKALHTKNALTRITPK